jgi:glycosyltransferase involved in cell wall biosynthesis
MTNIVLEKDKISMNRKPKLSLIIPAYNEAPCLRQSIFFIKEAVESFSDSYEIIIAEDGSSDGTDRIAASLVQENQHLVHSHADVRLGKGQALKRALDFSEGEIIVLMDADLATSLQHLSKLVWLINSKYDGAIGSRYSKGSTLSRTILRTFTSKTYNLLVRILFGSKIKDHQCGFKAFRRDVLQYLLEDVQSNGFIFDTELIVKAVQRGYLIAELPVNWEEPYGRKSKFNMVEDSLKMGFGLLKLKALLWKYDIAR